MTYFDEHTARIWKSLKAMDRHPAMTLKDLRVSLQARMRSGGVWQCTYCRSWLSLPEVSMDHIVPRKKGGVTSTDNLAESCAKCNRAKSILSYKSFHQLMLFLDTLPDDERRDILRRLTQKPSFRFEKKKGPNEKSWEAVAARNQEAYG